MDNCPNDLAYHLAITAQIWANGRAGRPIGRRQCQFRMSCDARHPHRGKGEVGIKIGANGLKPDAKTHRAIGRAMTRPFWYRVLSRREATGVSVFCGD
jgi:hypothetical protein